MSKEGDLTLAKSDRLGTGRIFERVLLFPVNDPDKRVLTHATWVDWFHHIEKFSMYAETGLS